MTAKKNKNALNKYEVMEQVRISSRDRSRLSNRECWTWKRRLPAAITIAQPDVLSSSLPVTSYSKFRSQLISFPGRVFMHSLSPNAGALSFPITLAILFLAVSLLSSTVCASTDDEELVCQKGLTGLPGATFPRGDIFLEVGRTLEVYCRLNLAKSRGYNASFIKFILTKSDVPHEAIKTIVINETTALLRVENMNVSRPHLSCEIAPPGSKPENFIQVCQNDIDVGYSPLPVEDFRCIARGWRSLNCTWKKAFNPIPTNYAVELWAKKTYLSISFCPANTTTPTSCLWTLRTDPFYRANLNPIHMRINGTNVLKPSGVTWDIIIDHWSIVVPDKPTHVEQRHINSTSIAISWSFELFRDLIPGLYHQIRVCINEAPNVPCNITTLKSSKGNITMEHNLFLPYAHVNYTVEIRMRSQNSKDEVDLWSQPATIVVSSGPKTPEFPPHVDIGSYESVSTALGRRDIFIYWKDISRLDENGPDFHYVFTIYEDGERKTDTQPKEITRSYAKFTALWMLKSYRFLIYSANSVGNSSTAAEIFVPKNNKVLAQPRSVSKLDFTNGSFEVSWQKPKTDIPIVSYTVFRCISEKPRPYHCQGLMKWDSVSSEKQTRMIYDYLPHHTDKIYQFSVSANSVNMSSGMIWASCTLIHNKVPEKLKKVEKTSEEEKEIHIEWRLDCSYQPGVIEGFKITYCLVEKTKPESCIDDEKSEAVQGYDKTTYNLKKLKPFSTYMIAVSVITLAGESQKSDPIYATTKESAPSTPPIGEVTKVTNTSAFITLLPPHSLNGILQKYKINYRSVEDPDEQGELIVSLNMTTDNQLESLVTEGVINQLVSNANYSYTISACTVRCSEESEPSYFKTMIGRTNFKTYPFLGMSGDSLVLEWKRPDHLGGPVKSFEILIRQDGEVQNPGKLVEMEFQDAIVNYRKELKFQCESNTNFTAQVRAVTELDTGELISGEWSPPGNFSCGGSASWIMWIIVIIAVVLTVAIITIGSTKVYQYVKQMKEFDVKLPPGLAVQDLNGFYPKRTRKNSEGDTQSFGKENLTYQLQMRSTNQSNESKDFFPLTESSLRENKTEFSDERDLSYDNKVFTEEVDSHHISKNKDSCHNGVWNCTNIYGPVGITNSPYPHAEIKVEPTSLQDTDQSPSPPRHDEDQSVDKRKSPSLTERLLNDSEMTEEDDNSHAHVQLISQHQPNYNIVESIVLGNGSTLIHNPIDSNKGHIDHHANIVPQSLNDKKIDKENPSASKSFIADIAVSKANSNVPDVLNPSTVQRNSDSGRFANSVPNPANVNIPLPPSSSYVTWNQLGLECKNNDTPIGIGDNSRRSPYCQVGILLDSN